MTRFEIADPSIEQIFMERVGKSTREDVSLAGVPDAPGLAAVRGAPGMAAATRAPGAARPEDPEARQ